MYVCVHNIYALFTFFPHRGWVELFRKWTGVHKQRHLETWTMQDLCLWQWDHLVRWGAMWWSDQLCKRSNPRRRVLSCLQEWHNTHQWQWQTRWGWAPQKPSKRMNIKLASSCTSTSVLKFKKWLNSNYCCLFLFSCQRAELPRLVSRHCQYSVLFNKNVSVQWLLLCFTILDFRVRKENPEMSQLYVWLNIYLTFEDEDG